jgi:DNA adenine methylase
MRKKLLKIPLKRHGGKFYLADWIISHFPSRDTWHLYREPYFGGGSVLLRLDPEGISEAVNDLDRELMDFWQVLATTPDRMLRQLWATPFSPEIWDASMASLADDDRVRRATAFFIRCRQSRQGLMKNYATPTSRIRGGMSENVSAWWGAIDSLPEIHERLRRVEIYCMDAIEFILKTDHPKAFFYLDPPYLHETRTVKDAYQHEMTDTQHNALLSVLEKLQGKFLISGYHSDLYDGWAERNSYHVYEKQIDNKASSSETKRQMTEVLWANYKD